MFDSRHIIKYILLATLWGCGQMKQAGVAVEHEIVLAGEMVLISGGTFEMGDLNGGGDIDETPVHSVSVPAFYLGIHEVTFAQWDECVDDGWCGGYYPDDEGWGRGNRPVVNVTWDDTQAFIDWLNSKTKGNYRLPTEAEWEFAARAESTTKYSWGNDIGEHLANCSSSDCGDRWMNTAPVGSFPANAWGLHDMHGNVEEWVQDCGKAELLGSDYDDTLSDEDAWERGNELWVDRDYDGAPTDGSAWESGDCGLRILRGGSWLGGPRSLRSSHRTGDSRLYRNKFRGFRLAKDQ